MPVVDGIFTPRGELVLAETVVDFAAIDNLVLKQRIAVEQATLPAARRLAASATDFLIPSQAASQDLALRLEAALERTLRFAYRSAQRELRDLRKLDAVQTREILDSGQYPRLASAGLAGVRRLIRRRVIDAAQRVGQAALTAAGLAASEDMDETEALLAVAAATKKSLHLNVLELVGEVLNLGRTAGVLEMDRPPTFAVRSEQLDKATCEACSRLHGAIVEVDSSAYYEYMPPAGCYGGGRCRGFYVFGDGPSQVRGPSSEPGPQPEPSPIPPVEFPRRRAA